MSTKPPPRPGCWAADREISREISLPKLGSTFAQVRALLRERSGPASTAASPPHAQTRRGPPRPRHSYAQGAVDNVLPAVSDQAVRCVLEEPTETGPERSGRPAVEPDEGSAACAGEAVSVPPPTVRTSTGDIRWETS